MTTPPAGSPPLPPGMTPEKLKATDEEIQRIARAIGDAIQKVTSTSVHRPTGRRTTTFNPLFVMDALIGNLAACIWMMPEHDHIPLIMNVGKGLAAQITSLRLRHASGAGPAPGNPGSLQ